MVLGRRRRRIRRSLNFAGGRRRSRLPKVGRRKCTGTAGHPGTHQYVLAPRRRGAPRPAAFTETFRSLISVRPARRIFGSTSIRSRLTAATASATSSILLLMPGDSLVFARIASVLGPAAWCRAGIRPEAGPRGVGIGSTTGGNYPPAAMLHIRIPLTLWRRNRNAEETTVEGSCLIGDLPGEKPKSALVYAAVGPAWLVARGHEHRRFLG
jgi:hypothetical protein